MSKKKRKDKTRNTAADPIPQEQRRTLMVLAFIGAASSFWALFLWQQLLKARAGGTPFCGFGGSDCGDLWDAGFASTIHDTTLMPVAGWGVVWGMVAGLLPLLALGSSTDRWARSLPAAVRTVALVGIGGVVVLLGASASEGLFCTSCALTYALTGIYAAIALLRLKVPMNPTAVGIAAAATAVAYLLLLYPAVKTPKSQALEGQKAIAQAVEKSRQTETDQQASTDPAANTSQAASQPQAPQTVEEFVASLSPEILQNVSDALDRHRHAKVLPTEAPRVLALGSPVAPVRITEFTDALCSHCATLHETMDYFRSVLPGSIFSLDARHYPLDGNCNPAIPIRGPESVRCLASKAQICMENDPRGFEFSGAIFRAQRGLTEDILYRIAEPFIEPSELKYCVNNPETEFKLQQDLEIAERYNPEGTPLVLINGRQASAYGPFLFAMILAGGNEQHPAFAQLPTPREVQPHVH